MSNDATTEGIDLDQQIDFVSQLVASLEGPIVLVGHSGAGAVVQGVVDRDPDRIDRVIYVDSGPLANGAPVWDGDAEGGDLELPDWDELEATGASLAGLDPATLTEFRSHAVAQPRGVAGSTVQLSDPRRLETPVSVICTSFPSAEFRAMAAAGVFPTELSDIGDVRYLDLPTGHWPMFSRPSELARMIVDECRVGSDSTG
jgi:pimeloyl-ACP methyl ester carboxylesterase